MSRHVEVCVAFKIDDPLPGKNSTLTSVCLEYDYYIHMYAPKHACASQQTHIHTEKENYLLLVVGDDTADKVRLCLTESLHQVGQLLLVKLTDCTEHAFPCPKLGSC